MQELVEYLVKALVDDPEAVHVEAVEAANLTVFQVSVAPSDLGKVIGRGGRIADALRCIVKAAATKTRERATVEILS